MKKSLLYGFFMLTTIMLCGCNMNPTIAAKKECKNILEFLSNDDTEGLGNMFCNIIVNTYDFDEQVQGAVDFFEGKVVSYDITSTSYMESVRGGKQVDVHTSPYIENIETDTGEIYTISFYSYLICVKDRNREGISELLIKNSDGETYVLGDYDKVNPGYWD